MSEITSNVPRHVDDGDRIHRRQSRITARLLKEYTARLYQIADVLGMYVDRHGGSAIGPPVTQPVITSVGRYRLIWEDVLDSALYASQMLVHYGLDEAEAAELRVRLKDAEYAVGLAGGLVNEAILSDQAKLGMPITSDRFRTAVVRAWGKTGRLHGK